MKKLLIFLFVFSISSCQRWKDDRDKLNKGIDSLHQASRYSLDQSEYQTLVMQDNKNPHDAFILKVGQKEADWFFSEEIKRINSGK